MYDVQFNCNVKVCVLLNFFKKFDCCNSEYFSLFGRSDSGVFYVYVGVIFLLLENRVILDKGQVSEDVVEHPPSRLSRARRRTPCLSVTPANKGRRVIVLSNSLLMRMEEAPMCWPEGSILPHWGLSQGCS